MVVFRRQRKTEIGDVVSAKCNKTRVVSILHKVKHPLYKKFVVKKTKIMIHDEENKSKVGDSVEIMECRPLSKRKRWRLLNILKK